MTQPTPKQQEIINNLQNFTGTENWHKFSMLFPKIILTDGALYVAESCGAFWLMDIIGSVQNEKKVRGEDFQAFSLKVEGSKGMVTVTDGNKNVLYTQKIEYTDFPLPEITLWCVNNGEYKTVMLPSEY